MLRTIVIAAVLSLVGPGSAHAEGLREHLIKAAFLYNFAKFVEWPDSAFRRAIDPIVFCIDGAAAFDGAREALSHKSVRSRTVDVIRVGRRPPIRHCHVHFVSRANACGKRELSRVIGKPNTLTVSDCDEFIDSGGIVGLVTVGNKIRFDVNLAAAKRAKLKISARLLKLARTVSQKSERGR